ncbi:hypothetical protein GCM10023185_00080 [Hymenobacter saemangeumensis]|uniref:Uncharacterized protein n=1 Tax=Hymenobacter saemangeumensis TaxID=1084522 RepID=A0ABP8HW71_9BACT
MSANRKAIVLPHDLPRQERGLGSAQHEVLVSVMKVIHRQAVPVAAEPQSEKVTRLSCCCRISELIPLVRQLHDEARAKALSRMGEDAQQAA